jgi:hypothetical protein
LQFVCLFWNLSNCILLFFSCTTSLLASLALIVQVSLPYNKTRRASVLYNFILVFLRVFFVVWSHYYNKRYLVQIYVFSRVN